MGEGAAFDELMKTKDRCVNFLSGLSPLVKSALTVATMLVPLAPAKVVAGEGELHNGITTVLERKSPVVFFKNLNLFWLSALHVHIYHLVLEGGWKYFCRFVFVVLLYV